MQKERALVNELAKEIYIRLVVAGSAPPEIAAPTARLAYQLAVAFAGIAKAQPGNEQEFQSFG